MTRYGRIGELLCVTLLCSAVLKAGPPSDFSEQAIGSGWVEPTGIGFDNTGKMYVWEAAGRVWTVENGIRNATPLLDIRDEVGRWRDHGLLGFALHPNFLATGYFYVYYTVDHHHLVNFGTPNYDANTDEFFQATIGRITRYTADGADNFESVVPGSRRVLLGVTAADGIPITGISHGVGQLVFGTDGTLLASSGDSATPSTTDTGGQLSTNYVTQALAEGILQPKEDVGAYRSQFIDSNCGKILRLDPATGLGVPNNPFFDPQAPGSARSLVYALGLRNPFRIALVPETGSHDPADGDPGVILIGDVGWNAREELTTITAPGQNCGWPIYEGFSRQARYSPIEVENLDAANPLGCQSFFFFTDLLIEDTQDPSPFFANPCDGAIEIPSSIPTFVHRRPLLDWRKNTGPARAGIFSAGVADTIDIDAVGSPVSGAVFSGNTSIGGTWYHGHDFPETYHDTYFHADYGEGWMKNIAFDANLNPTDVRPFLQIDDGGSLTHLATSPTEGGIYYTYWHDSLPHEVRRVSFVPAGNQPPMAVASLDGAFGSTPLTVQFTGSNSTDPESLPLSYEWNFGDGSDVSHAADPVHEFTAPAGIPTRYDVILTVTDDGNLTDTTPLVVSLNNTPPMLTITSPQTGSMYSATMDTVFPLTADLSDLEHDEEELSCTWQTFLGHNNHAHPEPVDTACTTSTTLSPTGCDGTETFLYRIRLTVCDPAGLCTQDEVLVLPDCPDLVVTTFDTVPSGLPLSVDDFPRTTPFVLNLFEDEQHVISVSAQACSLANAQEFTSWSDGGNLTHTITVSPGTTTYVATYADAGVPCSNLPFVQGPGPDHDLVMEAEHFHRDLPSNDGDNAAWTFVLNPAGFVDEGAMYILPDSSGPWKSVGFSQLAPILEFDFIANQTGTHNFRVRGQSLSTAENSVYLGLNGAEPALSSKVELATGPNWVWSNARPLSIATLGPQTLYVYGRERETKVDRIWGTSNLTILPSGSGPMESLRNIVATLDELPTALDDSFTVNEDVVNVSLSVLQNDDDPETGTPGTLTVSTVDTPDENGIAVPDGTGSAILYSPAIDFVGTESFTYTVVDEAGGTDMATVTVTVQNANHDPPDALDDAFFVLVESVDAELHVLFNDTDPDPFDTQLISDVTQPANGFVSIRPDGLALLFDAGISETVETFTYTLEDGSGLTATGTVTVTVRASADEKVFLQDPGPDGDLAMEAEHFHRASPATDGSDAQWTPVSDPVGFLGEGGVLVVGDSSPSWREPGFSQVTPKIEFDFAATHTGIHNVWVRGQAVSASANSIHIGLNGVEPPSNEPVQFSTGPSWVWGNVRPLDIPITGKHTLVVYGRESSARVDRIWITKDLTYVPSGSETGPAENPTGNGPLTARDDAVTVNEDVTAAPIDVLQNDEDPETGTPGTLTIFSVGSPNSSGTAVPNGTSTSLFYTPAPDFVGTEVFTYAAIDEDGNVDVATVTVTVQNDNNDPPTANNDIFNVQPNSLGFELDVLQNDTDPDPDDTPLITETTQPIDGSVSIRGDGLALLFDAPPSEGLQSFAYTFRDGSGSPASALVTVHVTFDAVEALSVDFTQTVGAVENFWNGSGFNPGKLTNPELNDTSQHQNLLLIGSVPHSGAIYQRPHFLLDAVAAAGLDTETPVYDWSQLDAFLDVLVASGQKVFFELMGNPSGYFNDFLSPTALNSWKRLVRDLALHLEARYGQMEVRSWFFETWNQPTIGVEDSGWLWNSEEEFYNYYDACSEGLLEADMELRFGGPGVSHLTNPLLSGLVEHAINGTNYFTGATGVRLDFVSYHRKSLPQTQVDLELEAIEQLLDSYPSLVDTLFVNNESDSECCWWNLDKEFRATPWYAAFIARQVNEHLARVIRQRGLRYRLANDNAFLGLWEQRTQFTLFGQNNGAFDLIKKPAHNVMTLLALLGDTEHPVTGSSIEDPVGVLATSRDATQAAVLVYHYDDDSTLSGTASVRLNLLYLPFSNGKIAHYRIDSTHGDTFSLWRDDLGSPASPDATQLDVLRSAQELGVLEAVSDLSSDSLALDFELPLPGVSLILISADPGAAPPPVTGVFTNRFSSTTPSTDNVVVKWDDSSRFVKTFEVLHATALEGPFTRVNATDLVATAWVHPLASTTEGFYKVRAVDYWGRPGQESEVIASAASNTGTPGGNAEFQQSSAPAGNLVMEAEHFRREAAAADDSGAAWHFVSNPGGFVAEGAMYVLPNPSGPWKTTGFSQVAPALEFDFIAEHLGVHNVWVRGQAGTTGTNSVYIGLDGTEPPTDEPLQLSVAPSWVWSNETQIDIPTLGAHTLFLYGRERATRIDRIWVTRDLTFNPLDSDSGPPESPRQNGDFLPTPGDDSFLVDEDVTAEPLDVLQNDDDPETGMPGTLIISAVGTPDKNGTAVPDGTSTGILYTPALDFVGTETFTYTALDEAGGNATATVTVTVQNADNDPPDALDDAFPALADSLDNVLDVLLNDTDPDPVDSQLIVSVTQPSEGFVSIRGDGLALLFDAAPSGGIETFDYTLQDSGGLDDTATVTVTVQDLPSGNGFQQDDGADGNLVFEAEHFHRSSPSNDSDNAAWTPVADPANFVGEGAMYILPDDSGPWKKVGFSQSAPTLEFDFVAAHTGIHNVWVRGQSLSTARNSVYVGIDGIEPPRSQPIQFDVGPSWLWGNAHQIDIQDTGQHTLFIYGRERASRVDRVWITSNLGISPSDNDSGPPESPDGVGPPANQPPNTADDALNVNEDVASFPIDVLENDEDPETGMPGTLIISAVGTTDAGGQVLINPTDDGLLYTPALDFVGTETFTYTALDEAGASATATVTIDVLNFNDDDPIALDDAFDVQVDSLDNDLDVLQNDTDPDPGDSQTIVSVTQPGEGFVEIAPSGLSLLFDAGTSEGAQTFDYTLEDSTGLDDTATVVVTVNATPAGNGFQQDSGSDGNLVFELEHYHRATPSNDSHNAAWTPVANPTDFAGDGAMYILPDPSGPWKKVGFSQSAPTLEIDFVATHTGVHNVWVRGQSLSTARNSIFLGLDGVEPALGDAIQFAVGSAWVWGNILQIDIPTTGQHTIQVYGRERATRVDRVWVTANLATNPSNADSGPPESPEN